jgi:hypothetical protein
MNQPITWNDLLQTYLIGLVIVIALAPAAYWLMWWAGKRKQNKMPKP